MRDYSAWNIAVQQTSIIIPDLFIPTLIKVQNMRGIYYRIISDISPVLKVVSAVLGGLGAPVAKST